MTTGIIKKQLHKLSFCLNGVAIFILTRSYSTKMTQLINAGFFLPIIYNKQSFGNMHLIYFIYKDRIIGK